MAEFTGVRSRRAVARALAGSHSAHVESIEADPALKREFGAATRAADPGAATFFCTDHSWIEGIGHGSANVHFDLRMHEGSRGASQVGVPAPRVVLQLSGSSGATTYSSRFDLPADMVVNGTPHLVEPFATAWNGSPALMLTNAAGEAQHEAINALRVETDPGGACRVTLRTDRSSAQGSRMVVLVGLCSAGCTFLGEVNDSQGIVDADSWSVRAASAQDDASCAEQLEHLGLGGIAAPLRSRVFPY